MATALSIIYALRSEDEELIAEPRTDQIEDGKVQDDIAKSGSDLTVTPYVTTKAYQNRKAVRRAIMRAASTFVNSSLYMDICLLQLMIPSAGP